MSTYISHNHSIIKRLRQGHYPYISGYFFQIGVTIKPYLEQRPRGWKIRYNLELISKARELRKNPTPAEKKLWWEYLRDFPFPMEILQSYGLKIIKFTNVDVAESFESVCQAIGNEIPLRPL